MDGDDMYLFDQQKLRSMMQFNNVPSALNRVLNVSQTMTLVWQRESYGLSMRAHAD